MTVIRPNCRLQFTAEDIAFILDVLEAGAASTRALQQLLTDDETRDLILDDEALFRMLLERRGCVRVSPQFYFYVLVRRVLRRAGLEDRTVADYVAELLAEFSHPDQSRLRIAGQERSADYFFEMIEALQTAHDSDRFRVCAHIGNCALFLAGVFPDRIRFRAERHGAPDLRYYEALGRANYRAARDHRLARRYALAGVFDALSARFRETRQALNELADRLLHLDDGDDGLEAGLRRTFQTA